MSDLQKLGSLVALVVGLLTIASGVWTAATNMANINSKLDQVVLANESTNKLLQLHSDEISEVKQLADSLKKGALLYVYSNEEHLVLQTPKGEELKIPLINLGS